MVLSVSSRVFVGEVLCRDPAWLAVVSAYLAEVVDTASRLKPYPRFARSFLRPILALKRRIDKILMDAQNVLAPAIIERRETSDQYTDLLKFLI